MSRKWKPSHFLQASLAVHGIAAVGALSQQGLWPLSLGAIIVNHAALTLAGLLPRSKVLGPNLTRLPLVCADRQEIALTLDDGPDPEVTPIVLDMLDAAGVKASFFCIGWRARRYPEICRQIVARGHRIENHGDAHSWAFSTWGPQRIKADIEAAQVTLADITGQTPEFFRPTAGLRNPFLEPVLCDLGLYLATWTRRGFDTRERQSSVILQRLKKSLAAGDILLMHDGNSARTPEGKPVILSVLPVLLQSISSLRLVPVTLVHALHENAIA
jgi:peptidoglycan/xylan/chitin deacetylase (PgdA/CDA1 family)